MVKVYSYLRFSSSQQEQGDSIRRQTDKADKWMIKHPEYTLDTDLRMSDLGVPAFRGANLDPEKGDLGKFIALVGNGEGTIPKGSILLLERLDRFSRLPPRKVYRIFCELVENGITIQTLEPEQTIDISNIDDMAISLTTILHMQIAHEQSKLKSSHCSDAWQSRKKKARESGLAIHKRCPSWLFVDDDGKYQVKEGGKEAIEYIYRRTLEGIGTRVLLKELNAKFSPIYRVFTNKRGSHRGGKWSLSTLASTLNNRSVLGEYQPMKFNKNQRVPDGEIIQNYYPRVIDDATFYAVQGVKQARKHQRGPSSKFINLLTGLVFGKDTHPMHISIRTNNDRKYKYRRLVSYGHLQGIKGSCCLSVDYFAIENAVLSMLNELTPQVFIPNTADSETLQRQNDRQNELEGIQARLNELQEQLLSSNRSVPALLQAITTGEARKDELHKQIEATKQEQAIEGTAPLAKFQEILATGNAHQHLTQLRMLVASLVRRIEVEPIKISVQQRGFRCIITMKNGEERLIINATGKTNYETLGTLLRN